MQEIPGFKAFDAKLTDFFGGIKEGKKHRKWWRLTLYVVFLLILFILSLGALSASLNQLGIVKDNIFAPEKRLTYEKIDESKNDDGSYTTTFSIKTLSPEGTYSGFHYYFPRECDKDFKFITAGGNLSGGVLYAQAEYRTTCKTDQLMIDSGELFKLKPDGITGFIIDVYAYVRTLF